MRTTAFGIFCLLLLPAGLAEARPKPEKEALAALEEALDLAQEDRSCKRAIGEDLSDAVAEVEDGGKKALKKAQKLLESALDGAEDCERDVKKALKEADQALADALEEEDDDGEDDDGRSAKKKGPAPEDPEVLEAACEAKKAKACFALGERYTSGQGVDQNESTAVEYYQRACALKHLSACNTMGNIHHEGWGGAEQSDRRAFEYYQKACDGGHGDACHSLGYLTEKGRGVEANPKKALQLYEKSCKRGSGSGCFAVGNAHQSGFAGLKLDLRISGHRGHRDRGIVDTEIGHRGHRDRASWTPRSGIVDTEIGHRGHPDRGSTRGR
ncbi:MAG: sel1 repeat family protein [Deltaproteobacteria bacterium]|nr:sel1 repeat family protein [Deltaproteobacteria bacterium]